MAIQLCGDLGGNTGAVACAASPAKIKNWAIWGGSLTSNEYATATAIKAALLADSKLSKSNSDKLFLMPEVQDPEDQTEANTVQTFGSGLKLVTTEGLLSYKFTFLSNQAQITQLRKFNNSVVKVIVQDENKRIWGSTDSAGNFIGRTASIFFSGLKHGTKDIAAGVAYVEITFTDAFECFDDAVFVQPSASLKTAAVALLDGQLYEKAAAASNALKVSIKFPTAEVGQEVDGYSQYSTTLFNTASLWNVTNLATGASVTITSIAPNSAGYGVLTIDSTAYSALSSGAMLRVYTDPPPDLDTAGVLGIEGISFIHTKP